MIIETHGEVCRLGYLRVITSIVKLQPNQSQDYISSILSELVNRATTEQELQESQRPMGMIKSKISARNYIVLADGLGIIEKRNGSLAFNGVLYTSMRSSAKFDAIVNGELNATHKELLQLNQIEKFFFLVLLLTRDRLMVRGLIKWLSEREEVTRMEAMNYVMEEVYPQALSALVESSRRKSKELLEKLEEAQKFREKRLSFLSKIEWIKSSLYAKYRHVAPPRLEWLVDVGILERVGRGKYRVSEMFSKNVEAFVKYLSRGEEAIVEELFNYVAPLYVPYGNRAGRNAVANELLRTFQLLSMNGRKPVDMRLLELAVAFRLLENNQLTTPRVVHEIINNLTVVYPDKVYVTPGEGERLEITRLDVELKDAQT